MNTKKFSCFINCTVVSCSVVLSYYHPKIGPAAINYNLLLNLALPICQMKKSLKTKTFDFLRATFL